MSRVDCNVEIGTSEAYTREPIPALNRLTDLGQ